MLEEKTLIEEVIEHRSGVLLVKAYKVILRDGKVIQAEPHRFSVQQEKDPDAVMDDVNSHLKQMGFPEIDLEDRQWVRDSMSYMKEKRPRDTRGKFEVPSNESLQIGAIGVQQGGKGPLV